MQIPEEWLIAFNKRASEAGIPYGNRPWRAISEWTRERNSSVRFPSPMADAVFAWFEEHSPVGSHAIGSIYTGTYLYDAHFWKISIPLIYGIVNVNLLDLVEGMPQSITERLKSELECLREFASVATDCFDYGYGIDDIKKGATKRGVSTFALQLLQSGDGYLRATVDLLTGLRPNSRAMETARLATEMFLKAYLAAHHSLDEAGAKELGHNLEKAVQDCMVGSSDSRFANVASLVDTFPKVAARYQGEQYCTTALWHGFAAAQQAGTILARSLADRDTRPLIFGEA